MMKIDYYYWGCMCPIAHETITLLNEYKDMLDIQYHDITHQVELAQKRNIFFPFLMVVNEEHRYYEPISKDLLETLKSGICAQEKPYIISLGRKQRNHEVIPITKHNYAIASRCTGRTQCLGCKGKLQMYQDIPNGIIGFMHVEGDRLLGGSEYYPSLLVPYNILKGEEIAFITCVYGSDESYDYKSAPLQALETYLSHTYKKAVVISDEIGTFPNGDITFFLQHGYLDEKIVYADAYCKLHMLTKEL